MKYRKKPIVVEAVPWTGHNFREIFDFLTNNQKLDSCIYNDGDTFRFDYDGTAVQLYVKTLEGTVLASFGDYIIKGVNGEFYPCKPDVFEKSYEQI